MESEDERVLRGFEDVCFGNRVLHLFLEEERPLPKSLHREEVSGVLFLHLPNFYNKLSISEKE